MSGAVTWEVVGVIVGALMGAGAIVRWILGRFVIRDDRIKALDEELGVLRQSISDHKLYAAEHFATRSGLTEALNSMRASIDGLTGRIDTLIVSKGDGK